jgi:hypothetical protein
MANQLDAEGPRLTKLLAGKTIKVAKRHRESEVMLEFTDGSRFFVNSGPMKLDISVTGGQEDDGAPSDPCKP